MILLIILTIILLSIILKRIYHKKRKVILQIGPSLKDKGGMVTVMQEIMDSKLSKECRIIHIPTYISKKKFALFFGSIFRILWYKIIYRVELSHVHMASYGSFYRKSILIKLCRILNIKILLHCHGACFEEFYNSLNDKKQRYVKKIFNKCEKVIVLSESWKNFYSKFVEEDKIVIMYNSVHVPEKIERSTVNGTIKGVFLGRIGERKGVYDIIDAVEKLSKENIRVEITIAGDGEVDKAKKLIKTKKLEKEIKILNWINKDEKDEILRKSDFFLLPSYNEGMPLSVLEAMSYSLPVITSKVGGIPEIVTMEKNGILVEPGDKEELEEAIRKIVLDEKLRNNLAEKAFETINERFNLNSYIEKLEKIYKEIKRKNIKVCLTSSAGGHFMQLKQLFKMTQKYNTFILTEKNEISKGCEKKYKMKFLMQQERKNITFIFEFIYNLLKNLGTIFINNPDVIISTGAGATAFSCLFTKIFGGKVIYIESFAKVNSKTITGKIVYSFADEFYVQWEEMKKLYPKAHYEGGIY